MHWEILAVFSFLLTYTYIIITIQSEQEGGLKMSALTTENGKQNSVNALNQRRSVNKKKCRVDNSSLPAGSPMYFYCISCGEEIAVPENYINKPDLCEECLAMKKLGWL